MKTKSPQKKLVLLSSALHNWETLNAALRSCTEGDALALLQAEQKGKRRIQALLRIHARYNRLRAERERGDLLAHQECKS